MTNTEIIQAIKAEIERLKGQLIRGACAAQIEMETNCKGEAYDEVLSFLSTLESEKPMVLEKMEREEELKKAVHQVSEEIVKEIFPDDLENGDFFTEVDLKNCITRVAYQFADWQKEQMLKEAVEGKVIAVVIYDNGDEVHYSVTYPFGERPHSMSDKVKMLFL